MNQIRNYIYFVQCLVVSRISYCLEAVSIVLILGSIPLVGGRLTLAYQNILIIVDVLLVVCSLAFQEINMILVLCPLVAGW